LELRRTLLRDLQRKRSEAVLSGDRVLSDVLRDLVLRLQKCVAYAENRRHYAKGGRFFAGPEMHSLPPLQNAGDNRPARGLDNAG